MMHHSLEELDSKNTEDDEECAANEYDVTDRFETKSSVFPIPQFYTSILKS